jgi:hypothetical protein
MNGMKKEELKHRTLVNENEFGTLSQQKIQTQLKRDI